MPCSHAILGPGRQSLIWGKTTCRMWRGMHQGVHEAGGPNRKQRALTSKCMSSEAKKELLTTISDQQLLRYLYQGSQEKHKCSLVLNQEFNYQNRCDFEDRLIKLPKTQVRYQLKRCLSWYQLARKSIKMFTYVFLVNLFHKATVSFHKDNKAH